jgi:prepilin-type N-terminal cleavage/methylation domain-containing protein
LQTRVGMNAMTSFVRMTRNQHGFTLIETLIAVGILSLGLVGALAAMGNGATSVDNARRNTTALFLAEQGIEQAKAFAVSTAAGQGYVLLANGSIPNQGYNTIPGYPEYRRTVTVTNNGAFKRVDVQIFYRPVAATGAETAVTVSTQVVAH